MDPAGIERSRDRRLRQERLLRDLVDPCGHPTERRVDITETLVEFGDLLFKPNVTANIGNGVRISGFGARGVRRHVNPRAA
ncbi:hypothetical protein [Actinoallomurus vinaceus]|uniref:hypothetical protein n=1 Tax=Actinoallomurus vinaceus TaxID=1080074 RepID=UPI0031E991F3